MADFFAEVKRRHIYRVAAAYAVVAWLLLQLVNNVAPVLDLPLWVARAFLLALVVGFPVSLLFAWMRELAAVDAAQARATTEPGSIQHLAAKPIISAKFVRPNSSGDTPHPQEI
jgi:hypothetical protein